MSPEQSIQSLPAATSRSVPPLEVLHVDLLAPGRRFDAGADGQPPTGCGSSLGGCGRLAGEFVCKRPSTCERGPLGGVRVPFRVRLEDPAPTSFVSPVPTAVNLWPMVTQPTESEPAVPQPQPAAPKGGGAPEPKPESAGVPKRQRLPSPFDSPPFPGSEYQGYPLIGVPSDFTIWPLMKLFQGTPTEDFLLTNHTRVYGWVTAEANLSTSTRSNTPDSYWVRPNNVDVDQAVLVIQKSVDSVQTDHIDWGFRSVVDYGIDYRYFTAGGWFSDQLLKHNLLYGWDPTEQYFEVYFPGVAQGVMVRVGRWIACPDIETQYAPDNYMGSHSLLFTFDTYTQTGVMTTFKLSDQWLVQAALHSGTDMAPWYKGAIPTGAFGVRWVSKSNDDAFYTWLNAINNAKFRRFEENGQPAGHDNFNYLVSTWEHRFSRRLITKTESYIMWQRDAVVGGTPSLGPVRAFGGGGGIGADIPGTTLTFGALNYTVLQLNRERLPHGSQRVVERQRRRAVRLPLDLHEQQHRL